jgi:acetolactate synthase-1/2/3 large subunit
MMSSSPPGRIRDGSQQAARTLVDSLRGHGVDRVFCVAGESYLAVLDELYDAADVDVVTCRHEASAGFAALADARLTGRAGICLVSRGPGATNASIAVHAASQDASPLVLIVGRVPVTGLGREAFQELDCSAFFGPVAKACLLLLDPSRTAEFVSRAFRIAESGTPGPVVLAVPEDVLGQADDRAVASARWPARAAAADPADLADAARLLGQAQRPLLIAGGMLGSDEGRTALRAAAERHLLPVVTSNKRQDLLDNRHPCYAGHLHNNTPAEQRALLGQADLIVAVGTRLDGTTTLGRRLPASPVPQQDLIHVYPDAARIGQFHRPRMGVAADPVRFLQDLAALEATGSAQRAAWARQLSELETDKAEWQPHDSDDGVAFGAVVHALDELTKGDVMVTVDSGTFTSWVYRYLRLNGDGRMLGISSSAMGYGLPAGVAAALRLARPTVVFAGDGGFLMTGSELATAVERKLPLIVVIANNSSYATIRLHQERVYPGRTIATDLVNPDFALLARAYGALGLKISHADDIAPCLAQALAHGGPVVVEVRTSLSWITPYRRLAAGGGVLPVPLLSEPAGGAQ